MNRWMQVVASDGRVLAHVETTMTLTAYATAEERCEVAAMVLLVERFALERVHSDDIPARFEPTGGQP